MILAMIGDYLLRSGTFSFSDSPDACMGMTANVVPDWRYAVSSVPGFICAALFAVAAAELMEVMEKKYRIAEDCFYGIKQSMDLCPDTSRVTAGRTLTEPVKSDILRQSVAPFGISTNTMAKMGRGQDVRAETQVTSCSVLNCTVDDIMEIIPGQK